MEGTCSGKHGYIVCVSKVDEISQVRPCSHNVQQHHALTLRNSTAADAARTCATIIGQGRVCFRTWHAPLCCCALHLPTKHTAQLTALLSLPQGKIRRDGSGFATFKVTFSCLVFRPLKGEVLDCTVQSVNKVGAKQQAHLHLHTLLTAC